MDGLHRVLLVQAQILDQILTTLSLTVLNPLGLWLLEETLIRCTNMGRLVLLKSHVLLDTHLLDPVHDSGLATLTALSHSQVLNNLRGSCLVEVIGTMCGDGRHSVLNSLTLVHLGEGLRPPFATRVAEVLSLTTAHQTTLI